MEKRQTVSAASSALRISAASIPPKYPGVKNSEPQSPVLLINHPLVMLADEPTGNLDSKSSQAVISSFEQARHELNATIFMVTHDSYAASFCDRVII